MQLFITYRVWDPITEPGWGFQVQPVLTYQLDHDEEARCKGFTETPASAFDENQGPYF